MRPVEGGPKTDNSLEKYNFSEGCFRTFDVIDVIFRIMHKNDQAYKNLRHWSKLLPFNLDLDVVGCIVVVVGSFVVVVCSFVVVVCSFVVVVCSFVVVVVCSFVVVVIVCSFAVGVSSGDLEGSSDADFPELYCYFVKV